MSNKIKMVFLTVGLVTVAVFTLGLWYDIKYLIGLGGGAALGNMEMFLLYSIFVRPKKSS